PQLRGPVSAERWVDGSDKPEALLSREGRELDHRDAVGRERVGQRFSTAAGSCRGEDRHGSRDVMGGADQVVAERERQLVQPLEVVDHEEYGPKRAERPKGGLEDSKRVQSDVVARLDEDRLEIRP